MRILIATYTDPSEKMGGAEYQAMLIARGLAGKGYPVLFLATQSSNATVSRIGSLSKVNLRGQEINGLRLHRKALFKALEKFEPDICYVRVFPDLSLIAPICRELGIRLVSTSVHSSETFPLIWSRYTNDIVRHFKSFLSITKSTVHVCNTKSLHRKIRRWYPRLSIRTIYNGQPIPPVESIHHGTSGQIIWVNNFKPWKRPELFIELANHFPQYQFVMIGRMAEGRFGKKISKAVSSLPPNIEYLGPKPIDEVNCLISESDLLLYTSRAREGFGNSYLQAWFRGVPTVDLAYGLDGILEREGIGRSPGNFNQLIVEVEELMSNGALRQDMGRRAREYALQNHDLETLISNHESLFEEVMH